MSEVIMFVLGNFIVALAKVIDILLTLYMWIIIFRALISWVNPDPYNQIVIFLYRVTEPVMGPISRRLPMRNAGIDISPIIVILVIVFLKYFLVETMIQMASRF
jgi:YggT family protein